MERIACRTESAWLSGYRRLSLYGLLTLAITWLTGSWGSGLPPGIRRGWYHLSLAWEKIKIWKSNNGFYWIHIAFAALLSWKIIQSNHCKLGTVCVLFDTTHTGHSYTMESSSVWRTQVGILLCAPRPSVLNHSLNFLLPPTTIGCRQKVGWSWRAVSSSLYCPCPPHWVSKKPCLPPLYPTTEHRDKGIQEATIQFFRRLNWWQKRVGLLRLRLQVWAFSCRSRAPVSEFPFLAPASPGMTVP